MRRSRRSWLETGFIFSLSSSEKDESNKQEAVIRSALKFSEGTKAVVSSSSGVVFTTALLDSFMRMITN